LDAATDDGRDWMRTRKLSVFTVVSILIASLSGSALAHPDGPGSPPRKGEPRAPTELRAPFPAVLNDFTVVGHESFGKVDTNGDVWLHEDTAYVGTWRSPCTGDGVKVVDVSTPSDPDSLGRVGNRNGTSAEDVVVRSVATGSFTGDLLAVGIQRCGRSSALDTQMFGVEFWNVTDPSNPVQLSELGVRKGDGGVHELDLFQRGGNVYALLASPFREWTGAGRGDLVIVDATDPSNPVRVGQWGARLEGLSDGPYDGRGSFGSKFGHSVRASADGMKAFVSYWDLGVVTLDISDPANPTVLDRTRYAAFDDGDAHSMTSYEAAGTDLILQNDEDFDPRSPAKVVIGSGPAFGVGVEAPTGEPLWKMRDHLVGGAVYRPRNEGCSYGDYPRSLRVRGKIVVVRTYMTFFDPKPHPNPHCTMSTQASIAWDLGATAVLHDVVAKNTSPQWWDSSERFPIPIVFTRHAVAERILSAGRARLVGTRPSWGYLRVFDAATGVQVARFDSLTRVHSLNTGGGTWSIHNTETREDRAYASWYTGGVVALDLAPLDAPNHANPTMVGRFVPNVGASQTGVFPNGLPLVWGVAVDQVSGLVYVSDMTSGLWIVQPINDALPT
jgi:hypothetical protein